MIACISNLQEHGRNPFQLTSSGDKGFKMKIYKRLATECNRLYRWDLGESIWYWYSKMSSGFILKDLRTNGQKEYLVNSWLLFNYIIWIHGFWKTPSLYMFLLTRRASFFISTWMVLFIYFYSFLSFECYISQTVNIKCQK